MATGKTPVKKFTPTLEVATTLPRLSVPRSAEVMPVNHWFVVVRPVVVAETKATVEDAERENGEPVSQS